MARLSWNKDMERVDIIAKDGEELTPELVAAWGQAQTARELMNIGHWIEELQGTFERQAGRRAGTDV